MTPTEVKEPPAQASGPLAQTSALLAQAQAPSALRAYSDPVIFRDDRVLKTLLRKEHRYVPGSPDRFALVQTEVKSHMRKEVADWMLEVCEDQQSQPEVFCLAMNYFDRFLSLCAIARSQLQLLGAVCLLVAWKVREHEPLPAMRLVEYSDFNLTLMDIMVSHHVTWWDTIMPSLNQSQQLSEFDCTTYSIFLHADDTGEEQEEYILHEDSSTTTYAPLQALTVSG